MQAVIDFVVDGDRELSSHRPLLKGLAPDVLATTTSSSPGTVNATLAWMEPHPWLKPVERRVGVTIACLAWLGFEAWYDPGGLWFWLALGATSYAIWDFFLSGSYRNIAE